MIVLLRRLQFRAHEWLADRINWVQYPRIRPVPAYTRPTLPQRWHALSRQGKGWVLLAAFWGALILLSIYGNLID